MASFQLPPEYYLTNFLTLCRTVEANYSDILPEKDLHWLKQFYIQSTADQCLYVRLACRNPVHFLESKIQYQDIPDIQVGMMNLVTSGLLLLCQPDEYQPWAETLTKDDWWFYLSSESLAQLNVKKNQSKVELLDAIEAHWETLNKPNCSLVTHPHKDIIQRFQLLFFGNAHQSLTDFVLNDLEIKRYEQYIIDKSLRIFNCTEDILEYQTICNIRLQLQAANKLKDQYKKLTLITNIAHQLNAMLPSDANQRTFSKALNETARLLEGHQPSLALALYSKSQLPPARERRSRLLEKSGNVLEAWAIARTIYDTQNAAEVRDSQALIKRLFKKVLTERPHETPIQWPKKYALPSQTYQIKASPTNIEQMGEVLFSNEFSWIEHTENQLFNSVFTLAYWDVIFDNVKGAFSHPFQSAPHDLYSEHFLSRRQKTVHAAQDVLRSGDWQGHILKQYQLKYGLENPLFNWHNVTLPFLQTALAIIPQSHWLAIWDRMWEDLRANRNGFPDLVALDETKRRYRLIEVKGPGDRLQKNQIEWLHFFVSNGVPVEVAHIEVQ